MPYEIIKSTAGGKKGYRLRKEGTNEYFSKKALPLQTVKKQRTAIIISEHKGPIKRFEGGMIGIPKQFKTLHVPGKPKDFGDIVPSILEPGERVLSVENNAKIEKMIKQGKIPKLPGF